MTQLTDKKQSFKNKTKPVHDDKPWEWKPGQSGNPAGRPLGSHDPLKEIGRKIAESRLKLGLSVKERKALEKAGLLPSEDATLIEQMMIMLATSNNPAKITMFLERTYGKVAQRNINENNSFDWTKFINKYTDAELERVKSGEDPLEILIGKIPDVETIDK